MQTDNLVLWSAAIVSIGGLIWQIIKDRKTPKLTEAQAAKSLIDSDAVKNEIERSSRVLNAARDLRTLDLEQWADKMRYWVSRIKIRDDQLCDLIRGAYVELQLPMPEVAALPDVPDFPAPRSIDT